MDTRLLETGFIPADEQELGVDTERDTGSGGRQHTRREPEGVVGFRARALLRSGQLLQADWSTGSLAQSPRTARHGYQQCETRRGGHLRRAARGLYQSRVVAAADGWHD